MQKQNFSCSRTTITKYKAKPANSSICKSHKSISKKEKKRKRDEEAHVRRSSIPLQGTPRSDLTLSCGPKKPRIPPLQQTTRRFLDSSEQTRENFGCFSPVHFDHWRPQQQGRWVAGQEGNAHPLLCRTSSPLSLLCFAASSSPSCRDRGRERGGSPRLRPTEPGGEQAYSPPSLTCSQSLAGGAHHLSEATLGEQLLQPVPSPRPLALSREPLLR